MKKSILLSLLVFGLMLTNINDVQAQCKKFTKENCLPSLAPFTYNGQLNSAILSDGDVAELLLTFHEGQKYRINVCHQEILGDILFKVFDTKKNLLFENDPNSDVSYWDFISNSTQQLIIEVTILEPQPKDEVLKTGCVSILVGFMDE